MLNAALGGAADAVDALVGLLWREALEGDTDILALFFQQIVVSRGVDTGQPYSANFGNLASPCPLSMMPALN